MQHARKNDIQNEGVGGKPSHPNANYPLSRCVLHKGSPAPNYQYGGRSRSRGTLALFRTSLIRFSGGLRTKDQSGWMVLMFKAVDDDKSSRKARPTHALFSKLNVGSKSRRHHRDVQSGNKRLSGEALSARFFARSSMRTSAPPPVWNPIPDMAIASRCRRLSAGTRYRRTTRAPRWPSAGLNSWRGWALPA